MAEDFDEKFLHDSLSTISDEETYLHDSEAPASELLKNHEDMLCNEETFLQDFLVIFKQMLQKQKMVHRY